MATAYGGVIERLIHPPPPYSPPPRMEQLEREMREALKNLHHAAALEANGLLPILAARDETASSAALAARLAELLPALVEEMRANPHYRESAAVLHRTYVVPEAKQLAVAQELGVPFGTYRYRLRKAQREIAEVFAARLPMRLRPAGLHHGGSEWPLDFPTSSLRGGVR